VVVVETPRRVPDVGVVLGHQFPREVEAFNVFPALKGEDFRRMEGDVPPRAED